MGIRVDADTLKHQLALPVMKIVWSWSGIRRCCAVKSADHRRRYRPVSFDHAAAATPHIGQVQCGVWPAAVRENVPLCCNNLSPPASEQAASHPGTKRQI